MSTPLQILLVEDSASDEALLLRVLLRAGYAPEILRVETAPAMQAALEQRSLDIILSDHDLPEFSSLEALALRNKRRPDLPFIIVSGRIGEELIVSAIKDGAQDYVLKRDLSRLAPAIDRALREARAHAERRRAEAALRESEERYALAVRGSSDGIWDLNLVTRAVYYSPRFKALLGFQEHELADTVDALLERIHPEDLQRLTLSMREHLERRTVFDAELRVLTKQGERRWFRLRGEARWEEQGTPIRIAGSFTDLTERKRAEQELVDKLEIIESQLELIQRQKEAIRVLSTPIIEVWEGVLMAPVLGVLDRDRATSMMEAVLQAVVRARCRHVIIDLTGVETIDLATASHVGELIAAVELLGAQGMVVGIQPRVAHAIVAAGIDLSRVTTLANLRQALVRCMKARPGAAFR